MLYQEFNVDSIAENLLAFGLSYLNQPLALDQEGLALASMSRNQATHV